MLSFAEKRALQKSIVELNSVIASKPGFLKLREAQKAKADALQKLGLIKQQSNAKSKEINASGENTEARPNFDQEKFGLKSSGVKTRERINSQVASLVDQIQAGRDPKSLTGEEISLFRQYSGKGGLTENSQYEYYTPTHVAEGVWDMLKANGLGSGNVLEPSTGAGVFSATKAQGVVITGTEIDPIAATVNKVLHPEDHIFNQSFEKLAVNTPDNFFDGVIGNVPFGDVRGAAANDDPQYKKEKFIERYFISRVIDKTRPGGLIALVVPTRVIGSNQAAWKRWRSEISRKAEFLGGHKLPSKTFGKQGTDVVTDILVMRKHSADFLEKVDGYTVETLESASVLWDEFISGKYWQGEGRKYIKGQYVPPNKDDFRPMEKVIADEGMTDQALKQSLAVHFESRIDWALLDSVEPVINYYAEGDRRIIAGKEHEFDGISWNEVTYSGADSTGIDKAKFGFGTIEGLSEALKSPESALSLTFAQAQEAMVAYPNLFSGQIKDALMFAQSQPLDSFREQAWRGSIIGSVVTRYVAKANYGDADDLDRQRIKTMLETEFSTYGHPRSIKGFRLDGEQARYFGSFLQAINESGKVSSVIESGVQDAAGYAADNPLSIVEYYMREGLGDVTLEDFKRLYAGSIPVNSLADIADIQGIVITPDGFISTTKAYCSGLVYEKAAAIQAVIDGESDPRMRDHYQRVIDTMMAKAKHTNIEDITFGLRDKWYDAKYKIEFLAKSGYRFEYSTTKMVEKESETGESYTGVERSLDTSVAGGLWSVDGSQRKRQVFARQLEYYMNGQSIGYRMSKEDDRDKEVIAKLREQVDGLEEQFKYFMQSHPDFQEIERRYNVTFNHYVKPEYDDSDLGLKGMSGKIKLHWYQNQGVRQLSEEGAGILGFDVGLGKSFSALALSAYDRQMGRSKKHCIVVPNSVLANWYMESKTLYGHHDDVMFVGFEPVRDKNGGIEKEAILDENGNPKVNQFTGQIEYQDRLRKETPDEVYAKMHLIPHTDKSVVIMTQEKFKDIPLREETRSGYAEKWVDKSMMSKAQAKSMMKSDKGGDEGTSYNDAKAQDRLRGQFSDEGGVKKDQYPYFEDMGFDRVIVDEAHQFRNSYSIQDGDTAKLAYLPNAAVSQRATDMAMKCAYLRDRYNNKGPIMLTATPVANSPIEIFNMLSLVIDQSEFERIGIYTPDDFVRQFGIIQDVDKLTVRGTVEKREGLAGFKNLNALRGLFHRYSLMRGPKDVDPDGDVMKLPQAVEMIDQLDMTAEQNALYSKLRAEAKDAANPQKIKEGLARPMFAVLRDMDRVTTDPDMYHGVTSFVFKREEQSKLDALIAGLPDEVSQSFEEDEETGELKRLPPNSKKKGDNIVTKQVTKVTTYTQQGDTLLYVVPDVYSDFVDIGVSKHKIDYVSHPLRPKYAKMLENMRAELSNKGKQLVFTEEKSQHTKMLRLISNHLPVTADQVAVINADTAAGEKLQQISDAFNRGDVRIIIANKKAEVGVNLQKGTSAIHHLTLPWNPASLQQRNGRGVRQGNTQSHVRVYYYQGRGSFDEYRLDLLKNKGNWIAALMDRNADNDSAENAEAMGAIEQAALLSENREEFLKTMAEMQAKKDAEAKARRDSTARIKLNQLAIQAHFLAGFEAQKEAAKAEAQRAVESARNRLDRVKEQGDEDEIKAVTNRLAIATKRLEGVDSVWGKKKAEAEQQMRQNTAFLKGMERQGQLSFDPALIDSPAKNILTKDQKIVSEGSVFKLSGGQIIRVKVIDFYKRAMDIEKISGGYISTTGLDVDKALEGATELNLAPDELEKMKWLSMSHRFADFTQVDKEFFFKHFGEINFSSDILYYDATGKLKWGSPYYAKQEGAVPVYPDRNDKKLIDELKNAYKAMKQGSQDIYSGYFAYFMPVMFGEEWEKSLLETMKTANKEDILARVVSGLKVELSRSAVDADDSTKAGVSTLLNAIDVVSMSVRQNVTQWMIDNEFVNVSDVGSIVSESVMAKKAELQERRRQIEADEQRAKSEALKSVPGYREISPEIREGFKQLGIDVWFNDEVVQIATRFDKVTYQPFDQFWMKDSGWRLKDKISGAENPLKRRFNAKYLGVKYSSELPRGDAKYGKSTWRVPADTDLAALLEALK